MQTVRIYRLDHLSKSQWNRLQAAQMEAAAVWNLCMQMHKQARLTHRSWPGRNELQPVTKGRFALHSQSVQMIVHAFLANIETTRKLRPEHPEMRMKYPWQTKRFYPVHWPAQAVCAEEAPGTVQATVDLGEIHLAAVSTNTGQALIVTGRGIRSLKRQRARQLGKITKKQSRCQKHSRRWKKLQRAKNKVCRRSERRVRNLRHKASRQVINFCVEHKVGSLFIGNPHGVRNRDTGRHHNQRLALWEYGKDIDYLTHKSKQARILSFTGSERGTSSRCPRCGHKHKPKGRTWACRACGFTDHRDLVGSVNMHTIAYGTQVEFPRSFTYLRPGNTRSRSSRADTPQRCLGEPTAHPLLAEQVSSQTGHPVGVARKPVPLKADWECHERPVQ